MEGVAGVEEGAAGLGKSFAGGVGDPGGGDGAQGGDVAQAAPGLLEVGFEEEPQFAVAFGAFAAELVEAGEAFGGLVAPVGEDRGAQGGDEAEVAGDGAGVEQSELDLEVLAGGLPGLGGVRTEWSRARPRSQTGYQIRSARAATAAASAVPSCSRRRSRSLRGESSPRP